MKQPIKGKGGNASKPRVKKKSREELDLEARARKRQKKHRGNVAGSRMQPSGDGKQNTSEAKTKDPRIGSKKPVLLVSDNASAIKPVAVQQNNMYRMSPEEELEMLENDPRLDELLDRLERGEALPAKDQSWVDEKLDRIDMLMEQLGIALDDDEDEDKPEEDMLQLLKRNNPKDGY
ncbi:Der GTPase-activating protein YihI [Musicola keenii]|uniref:Der GTPase-activating protein YihI n=1 Tax=Musicola keenii TaxID=2884250 RepID=UPI001786D65B|nr:Der GTPase-activating protein YihI [Musicola keenii]